MMGLFSAIRRLFGRPTPTLPPYTPRPAATVVGINIHRGGQQEMDMLQDLGTKHARITMYLEEWHQPNRVAAWHAMLTHFDHIGVEPLLVLHMSTRRDWAKAAAEFKGRTWQLGNEVDATTISATQYAAVIATAIREMLAADPTATFVASGLARTDGQGTHDTSDLSRWTEWASALMELPQGTLQAICLHAYTDDTLPIVGLVQAVNNVVRGRVPLWVTEFGPVQHGGPNGIVPDDEAGVVVRAHRNRLPAWGIERVYWYCLNDGMDFAHGLVRSDDTKRPGYGAVKQWIGGGA
jgi:hypothetical protein